MSENTILDYKILSQAMQDLFRHISLDIMRVYKTDFTTHYKDNNTPVTQADIEAEYKIIKALKKITPNIPCVGEESYKTNAHKKHKQFWLIDPIDGTRAFVAKNNVFTINAGLIENGQPVFGIVYNPLDDEMYVGSPLGAFKNGQVISARSIPQSGAVVALSFIPTTTGKTTNYLNAYTIDQYLNLTSSIKICRIAEGRADLYPRFGTTCEWDTAAAHAILHYSGGTLRTLNGDDLVYGKAEIENPHFICKGLDTNNG